MTMPMLVVLAAAIVGNILGYTALKNFAANATTVAIACPLTRLFGMPMHF